MKPLINAQHDEGSIHRGYRPLLPAQAAVAERLRQQWASEQDTERVPETGEGEN